ncbi:beta-ketoacyl-ACP synthase II [Gracilimonas mengyeensis]|uniref:3-oxoacyl-[acyl-carrier-protein] synthase 2 n=1 Tax=Gracilimonas mengyeensis TaxID=1302730 RepID=A0A521DRS6_9BACT|nr:beta-ketoacyl-ACP synthase II [Gracilimonas mengyeensis]SMO74285.1 3-oxoacyl-[acyl-carrier-protein] synthase II [Gracilimonas mengyeensis]
MKRVVITGVGALTPIGETKEAYWNALQNGTSGADKITRFDTTKFKTDFACELKNYDPANHFDRKEIRRLDRFSQYGLVAAEEAIQDANLQFNKLNKNRSGVIFSSGIGGFETFEKETLNYAVNDFNPRFSPFFITKIIANGIAGQLSIKYGLRGVNYAPVTACASSTNGIIQAFNYIKWGKADLIITGGSEAPITETSIGGFNTMKALSTNNENYASASRPFDKSRDGFVVGEGAGALVIESLESALRRDAHIYAEIVGGGESSDAHHIVGTHPNGEGAYLAMSQAIEEAGISSSDIDHINAHATSTGPGDLSEIRAIERVMEENINRVHISAPKSMTGHLLGAAGAVEAIATCLALESNIIPPTINTEEIDEQIPKTIDLTLKEKKQKDIRLALSNSFGFGGHCAAIIMKKYEK